VEQFSSIFYFIQKARSIQIKASKYKSFLMQPFLEHAAGHFIESLFICNSLYLEINPF